MGYTIIGIFLNIERNSDNKNYKNFIQYIASLNDLELEVFLEMPKYLESTDNELINEGIEKYKTIIENYNAMINRKDRKLSVLYYV